MTNETGVFELLMANAIKIPGVKVNRNEFLAESFSKHVTADQMTMIIEKGPIEANVDMAIVNKIARNIISNRTMKSSSISFAAGVPGGLAMAATIPADTAQFFAMILRLAQEIGYIYGYEDFWENDVLNIEKVNGDLVLFIGVMFGVGGAAASIRVLSGQLSKQALSKIPNQALTRTIYYPIVKRITALIGVKMTKDSFAKGVSKVIPLLGGIVSGGLTFATMSKMGSKLAQALEANIDLSTEDIIDSLEQLKKQNPDIVDADFEELISQI